MKPTTRRVLGGIAGGLVGAVLYVAYRLCTSTIHISSSADILLIPFPGLILGGILGAIFPKPFVWAVEQILHLIP